MISTCLTYEQLQAYSSATINKTEKSLLYTHISNCELCACAVNGFAAISFTSDELVAIHSKIDAKTNATAENPLTFSRVIIMLVSFIAIATIYIVADNGSKQPSLVNDINPITPNYIIPIKNEKKTSSSEEISSVTKTFKKIVNKIQYQKFERAISSQEKLYVIEPISIQSLMISNANSYPDISTPENKLNSLYIYDLKISDYNNLYFSYEKKEDNSLFKTHTPVSLENKKSLVDDEEEAEMIASDKILKKGLLLFRAQNFNLAISNFSQLLERNKTDVNAQFYSALAYYNLNDITKATGRLNEVLANNNTAFYFEAQWYLALAALKNGDVENAKIQLFRIVSEKGFYSKSAGQKLNNLQ